MGVINNLGSSMEDLPRCVHVDTGLHSLVGAELEPPVREWKKGFTPYGSIANDDAPVRIPP